MKIIPSQRDLMIISAEKEYNESLEYYSNTIQNFNNANLEFTEIALEEMNLAKQMVDVKYRKLKLYKSSENK